MPLPFDHGLKPAAPRKAPSTPAPNHGASNGLEGETVSVEFPTEFWDALKGLAQESGVTPETVISAGTSLYALAMKAKAQNQKLAVIESDQPCVTEIKGL